MATTTQRPQPSTAKQLSAIETQLLELEDKIQFCQDEAGKNLLRQDYREALNEQKRLLEKLNA